MKTLIQRVKSAQVEVDGEIVGRTGPGLLLFVGVEKGDTQADAETTARKIAALRIFPGRTPMDQTISEIGGRCLVVSQFTLAGNLSKGNRPSFEGAELPPQAEALYLEVAQRLRQLNIPVETGRFGAHMEVHLVNDGPVTFWLEVRDGRLLKPRTEG